MSGMDNRKKSPDDYIFGKVIGEGSFSTVYLAKEVDTGREFASKYLPKLLLKPTFMHHFFQSKFATKTT